MPKSPLTPVRLSLGGGGVSCISSSAASRTRAELSLNQTEPLSDSPHVWHEHATSMSPHGHRPTSAPGLRTSYRHCSCQTALHEVRAMLAEAAAQCDTLKVQLREARRREREQAEATPPSTTTIERVGAGAARRCGGQDHLVTTTRAGDTFLARQFRVY